MSMNNEDGKRNVLTARWIFRGAAFYGILALAPQYFLEGWIGRELPPAITHPEHFYGFIGVALVWQFVFLIIAQNPIRYRTLMIPAVLEKLAFGGACIVLFAQGRIPLPTLGAGILDLLLGCLFAFSYFAPVP